MDKAITTKSEGQEEEEILKVKITNETNTLENRRVSLMKSSREYKDQWEEHIKKLNKAITNKSEGQEEGEIMMVKITYGGKAIRKQDIKGNTSQTRVQRLIGKRHK